MLIYINDLLDDIRSDGLLVADDKNLFRKIMSREDAIVLQADIRVIESWSQKWLLNSHFDKCHVPNLGRFENIMHTQRYNICGLEMEHVFEEKDLAVIVDSDLTFEKHISSKIRTANAIVGFIRRSFTYLDCKSFVKIYTAFLRPHIEYVQSVWSPCLMKHINLQYTPDNSNLQGTDENGSS